MMSAALSVVIVNYNGKKYLKDCLDAIGSKLDGISFETIIVDNASSDGSVTFLKQFYPDVIIIESPVNLGFGAANNAGVDIASSDKILFLNNDTILQDSLTTLPGLLDKHDDFGIITIKMLDGNRNYTPATGKFPSPLNLLKISSLTDKRPEFVSGNFDLTNYYEADWVTGAFMLMRKRDFLAVGGFDEDYFMYVEDVDLCKKISRLGKKNIFIPWLEYVHFVGFNTTRERQLIKGCEVYVGKHFNNGSRLLASAMLALNKLVKTLTGKLA